MISQLDTLVYHPQSMLQVSDKNCPKDGMSERARWLKRSNFCDHRLFIIVVTFIIVVISTWTRQRCQLPNERYTHKSQLLICSNGLKLFKISSLMSQFSTNKRTLSVFCCFLFAVFNNC